ncbi:hypothetical protein ACWY4P_00825 [Streptomyces sp. LZ34]
MISDVMFLMPAFAVLVVASLVAGVIGFGLVRSNGALIPSPAVSHRIVACGGTLAIGLSTSA